MSVSYEEFDRLRFDRPAPGVLRITFNAPEKLNALDVEARRQIGSIWKVIDSDPETRCTIVTGAGRAFCAGADFSSHGEGEGEGEDGGDFLERFSTVFNEGSGLVNALINARKPIVSAINGAAVGAGLAIALLADVPIAAKSAKLIDGHTKLGIAAGDHAAIIWPLLCGMAKAKYYLLTCEPMTGEQAERNNLVALAVEDDQLEAKSIEVAARLAAGPPTAIRMTKYVLNHWLRQQSPIFDLSLALELAGMDGCELKEGAQARREKRNPRYPGGSAF